VVVVVTVVVSGAAVVTVVVVVVVLVVGIVVEADVEVVVDLEQDAKTSDVTIRQLSSIHVIPLFIQTSFILDHFRKINHGQIL